MAAKEFGTPMADGGGSYAPTHIGTTSASPSSITLHLGVVEMPYSSYQAPQKVAKVKKGKQNKPLKPKGDAATKTTGEVAEILEEKYGVLDTFVFAHLPDIATALEESIAGELETLLMGGSTGVNPMQGAEASITTMMKKFISAQEIEHMGLEGVPTQAALKGVNHRLKHPYAKKNGRRPSFMDTTLYWQSLRAWFK